MKKIIYALFLSFLCCLPSPVVAKGKSFWQQAPGNLKKSWAVSVRLQCEEGKFLAILPPDNTIISELLLVMENPNVEEEQLRTTHINALDVDHREYAEMQKYLSVSATGEISVRATTDQSFYPIGDLSPKDGELACQASTTEALQRACKNAGWNPQEPGFQRCVNTLRESFRKGRPAFLPAYLRTNVLLQRTEPECERTGGMFDPTTARKIEFSLKFSVANNQIQFFPILHEQNFSTYENCSDFDDKWR